MLKSREIPPASIFTLQNLKDSKYAFLKNNTSTLINSKLLEKAHEVNLDYSPEIHMKVAGFFPVQFLVPALDVFSDIFAWDERKVNNLKQFQNGASDTVQGLLKGFFPHEMRWNEVMVILPFVIDAITSWELHNPQSGDQGKIYFISFMPQQHFHFKPEESYFYSQKEVQNKQQ